VSFGSLFRISSKDKSLNNNQNSIFSNRTEHHIKFMNRIILRIAFIFCAADLFSQSQTVKVGDIIHISNQKLISLNNYTFRKNLPLVIDFWATWCGPCIAALPHLDSLQRKYKDNVQFIALSQEPTKLVKGFIRDKKYTLSFCIDKDKELFKAFSVQELPITCLLSSTGKIIWVGDAESLDTVLFQYVHNKSVDFRGKINALHQRYYADLGDNDNAANTLGSRSNNVLTYHIGINTKMVESQYFAKTQKGLMRDSAINIKYTAVPAKEIIQDLFDIPTSRFHSHRLDIDTTYLDLLVQSRSPLLSYSFFSKIIASNIEQLFQCKIIERIKTVPVYMIKNASSQKLKQYLENTKGGGMVRKVGNEIHITRMSLQQMAMYFEKILNVFIVCEEDLDKYSIVLKKISTVDELYQQLSTNFDLNLEKGNAKIRFVEVF